jgi:DNA polymerase-3 subunit gamma/tau
MNLYRKARPSTLADLIGNEAEIAAVTKLMESAERPHTYLISGPSGCGKTTLARILANMLGSDEFGVHEINTANNRGIDTAREIEEAMQYNVIGNGTKSYIIDECHNITAVAQDALLKPLEDTPKHVYFFLCTTNPEKLKKAIHTRCTHIKMSSVDPEVLYKYMRRLAVKEGINVPKEIVQSIAENCEGSPRQALVLLEKVATMENAEQMAEIVKTGAVEDADTRDLCQALLKAKSWKPVADILKRMKTDNTEAEQIRYAVLGYMNAVLLNSGATRAAACIQEFSEPFYNAGAPLLTLACFNTVCADE